MALMKTDVFQEICLHTKLIAPIHCPIAEFLAKAPEPPPYMVTRNAVLLLKVTVAVAHSRGTTKHNGVKFVIYAPFLGYLILCFTIYTCTSKFYEGIKNLWIKIEKKNCPFTMVFFWIRVFYVDVWCEHLQQIDALDHFEDLTEIGYHLADLPLEPRLGKVVLYSIVLKCLDPVLTIVCALAYKDPCKFH